MPNQYKPRDWSVHPPYKHDAYASTKQRAPLKPLVPLKQTLSELTGPVYGHDAVTPLDADLTVNARRNGEPLGERIIVFGRVLDEDGRPVISRADSRTLEHVSQMTGGTTHELIDPNLVSELITSLEQFADVRDTEGFRLAAHRRYRLFLGLALAALAISLTIRVVRWRDMF